MLWQTVSLYQKCFFTFENFTIENKKNLETGLFSFLLLLLFDYAFTRVRTHIDWQIQLFNAMMTSNLVLIVLFNELILLIEMRQTIHTQITHFINTFLYLYFI